MHTGHIWEWEVLGSVKFNITKIFYLSYKKSIQQVKELVNSIHYPVTDPPMRIGEDLHAHVFDILSVDADDVKFYPAVGTSLDIFHGVDFFMEYDNKICTIDLSLRNKRHFKADVLFHEDDNLFDVAHEIANHLISERRY